MKILILSDTHHQVIECRELIRSLGKIDLIIHAGDCTSDAKDLQREFPHIPIQYVKGNNDFFDNEPTDLTFTVHNKKIFVTHGHTYGVKYGLDRLYNKAKFEDYDLIVFGHTHSPMTEFVGKCTIINPGTMGYYPKTYAIAEILDDTIYTSILEYKIR